MTLQERVSQHKLYNSADTKWRQLRWIARILDEDRTSRFIMKPCSVYIDTENHGPVPSIRMDLESTKIGPRAMMQHAMSTVTIIPQRQYQCVLVETDTLGLMAYSGCIPFNELPYRLLDWYTDTTKQMADV